MLKILFDMDGTIANLYGQGDWLECLQRGDSKPYKHAKPMLDMKELSNLCGDLISKGNEIEIVSWLAKDSDKEFNAATRKAKRDWLKENDFKATKIHLVKYGTPKARYKAVGDSLTILFDDNKDVRGDFESHDNCIAFEPNQILEIMKIAATIK